MYRLVCLAAVFLLVAPTHRVLGQVRAGDDAQEIRILHEQFISAWTAADVDRLMAFYADDAVIMAPNAPAFVGKEAIRSVNEVVLGLYTSVFTYQVDEIEVSDSLAFLRFTYLDTLKPKLGGEEARNGGYALMILRRGPDGSWKVWREMWTHVRERFIDDLLREK